MAVISATASPGSSRIAHGMTCMIAGMLLFSGQDGLMKFLLVEFPIWGLIAVRSAIAVAVLTPLILILGGPHRIFTPLWPWHLCRAGLFALGFSLFYTAFPFMTLASVTTIFFAGPLILALMAAMFLGETVGIHRSAALVAGFAGVVVVMSPGSGSFQWVSLLPLACAATYAVSQIIMRRIGESESSLTMGLYTLAFAGLFIVSGGWLLNAMTDIGQSIPHLRWSWDGFSPANAPWLIALGCIGMVGYILISRAYQVADASVIAPFEYSYIPMAAVVGYLFWGEVPTLNTLFGMVLIVASGLYIGYRELVSARRILEPPPTAETSFVPGSPPPQTQAVETGQT